MKYLSLLLLIVPSLSYGKPLQVKSLHTEHETNPTGVSQTPRLSWQLLAAEGERAKQQTAYHIIAASSPEILEINTGDLWDTKTQKSAARHLIPWAGKALADGSKVHWKVRVWDEKNEMSEWSPVGTFTVGGKRQLQPLADNSSFECSHPGLNKIFQFQKAELAKRLKKFIAGDQNALGLGIDVQRANREYLYHYSSAAALWHWVSLVHARQSESKLFPIAPSLNHYGAGNSDGGVLVPHGIWWMSGDAQPIAQNWEQMDQYMVAREEADRSFRGRAWGHTLFDQQSKGPVTSPAFIDLCYLGLSTRIMNGLCLPSQKPLNAIRYKDFTSRIHKSFAKQYLEKDGSLSEESLSSHLLALRCSVMAPEKREPVLKNLTKQIEARLPELGHLGLSQLITVLSLTHHNDLLFDLITSKSRPEINWELAKGKTAGSGITEWMMSRLAGIDASSAGFQQIRIAPQILNEDRITSVKAHHDSPHGRITVDWEKSESSLELQCTIPPGTIAIITLPATQDQNITESGKPLKEAFGTELMKHHTVTNTAEIIAQSGSYRFMIK